MSVVRHNPTEMASSGDELTQSLPRRMMSNDFATEPPPIIDGTEVCRICRGDGSVEQPLYYPCKCSGSIRFVHEECLSEWLTRSGKKYCELCKTPFTFTKVYDQAAPRTLPFSLLVKQISLHTRKFSIRWLRYAIVTFIWLVWMPWTIRQIWRGLFWIADGTWVAMTQNPVSNSKIPDPQGNFTLDNAVTPQNRSMFFAPLGLMLSVLASMLGPFDPTKFFRALLPLTFTITFHATSYDFASSWANEAFFFAKVHRPSSLLSGIDTLSTATKYPLLNNALLDILEGQILCISIIASLMLVFLIREWVLNQLPQGAIPNQDVQAGPELNEVARAGAQRAQVRRRRVWQRGQQAEVVAPPALRRHATENNILVAGPPQVDDRARANSFAGLSSRDEDHTESGRIDENEVVAHLAAPLLQRGDFDRLAQAQRGTRETDLENNSAANELQTTSEGRGNDTLVPTSSIDSQIDPSDSDDRVLTLNPAETIAVTSSIVDRKGQDQIDEAIHVSPNAPTDVPPQQDESVTSRSQSNVTAVLEPVRADESKTFFQRVSGWLWYVEPETLPQNESNSALSIEINHHGHQLDLLQPQDDPDEVRRPNLFDGIDLNNQEALDEAEDLEGIMELLGFEGPLLGVVQNIIFCVFLITLVLAISVWLPYVWGKNTLLFLANPITILVKGPARATLAAADIIVDLSIYVLAGLCLSIARLCTSISRTIPVLSILQGGGRWMSESLKYFDNLKHRSSSRLGGTISGSVGALRLDVPNFSMQAHHVLRVFKSTLTSLASSIHLGVHQACSSPRAALICLKQVPYASQRLPHAIKAFWLKLQDDLRPLDLKPDAQIDLTLADWQAKEKIICVLLGYALFVIVGCTYTRLCRYYLRLQPNEKVPGVVGSVLRQAGGVVKVIVIIGIEMILFPLYCGSMLDLAMLPLLKGASISTRIRFVQSSPWTAIFLHWFLGTSYMFHFALFVGVCRKTMRRGVLYFIRDPDDPNFHPIRDVLEKPVLTQLGKIIFSATVYGGVLICCLGGIIRMVNLLSGLFPVRWEFCIPTLKMPLDVIFFFFVAPMILRHTSINTRITQLYRWWIPAIAAGLRLSDFIQGKHVRLEQIGGMFRWRAFLDKLLLNKKTKAREECSTSKLTDPKQVYIITPKSGYKIEDKTTERIFGTRKFFETVVHATDANDKDDHVILTFKAEFCECHVRQLVSRAAENPSCNYLISQPEDAIRPYVPRSEKVAPECGTYVRAPAKDSCLIPKGSVVFLKVDENDKRQDGLPDPVKGVYGRDDEGWARVFIPDHFRMRVITFAALLGLFTVVVGFIFTAVPLILGRSAMAVLPNGMVASNDLYAYTAGLLVGVSLVKAVSTAFALTRKYKQPAENLNTSSVIVTIGKASYRAVVSFAKALYLLAMVGVILPLVIGLIAAMYLELPVIRLGGAFYRATSSSVATLPTSTPITPTQTIAVTDVTEESSSTTPLFLGQLYVLGFLYFRYAILLMRRFEAPKVALDAIVQKAHKSVDVGLITRALIVPISFASIITLLVPLLSAFIMNFVLYLSIGKAYKGIYTHCYDFVVGICLIIFLVWKLAEKMQTWQAKIRDEVYLVGERLHNYIDPAEDSMVAESGQQPLNTPNSTHTSKAPRATPLDASLSEPDISHSGSTDFMGSNLPTARPNPHKCYDQERQELEARRNGQQAIIPLTISTVKHDSGADTRQGPLRFGSPHLRKDSLEGKTQPRIHSAYAGSQNSSFASLNGGMVSPPRHLVVGPTLATIPSSKVVSQADSDDGVAQGVEYDSIEDDMDQGEPGPEYELGNTPEEEREDYIRIYRNR